MKPLDYISKMRRSNPEVDLHGKRVQEAIDILDVKIPEWLVAFDSAKIMYGHGTGQLKTGVVKYLRKHPSVREVLETPEGIRRGYVEILF